MIVAIINVALYLGTLLYYYRKKGFNSVTIVVILYLIVSFFGLVESTMTPKEWHLTLLPFLYLFVIWIMFMAPLLRMPINRMTSSQTTVSNWQILYLLLFIYILSASYTLFLNFDSARNAWNLGNWLAVRNEMYYGDVEYYTTIYERIAKNISSKLQPFAVVSLFYFLALKRHKTWIIVALGMLVFFTSMTSAIMLAARGTIFNFLMLFFTTYIFFKNKLSNRANQIIKILSIALFVIALLFSVAVTLARFDSDSSSSIVHYFGCSMIRFDYGVMDTIHSYANGRWILGDYYSSFDPNYELFDWESLGIHCGSSFITFIGCLYIDFGPILTFLIALLVATLLNKQLSKKRQYYRFADVFIMVFYLNFILQGAFIFGFGYFNQIVVALFIYFLLRIPSTSKKVYQSISIAKI